MARPIWSDHHGQAVLVSPSNANRILPRGLMSRSKAEEITHILREEILRGQYRAGERLPSERDLSARFDANRGAVREAIKKLEQLGIAEVKPGGVRIVPIEDATLEVLGYLMDLEEIPNPTLVGQLFEVFGAMMSLSARSAVKKATEDQIDEMRRIVKRLIACVDTQEDYYNGWRELGEMFTTINQNLILRLIGNGLKTQFVGRLEKTGIRPKINTQRDVEFLTQIEDAMAQRNHQQVSLAIVGHFGLLRRGFVEALEQEQSPTTRSITHA